MRQLGVDMREWMKMDFVLDSSPVRSLRRARPGGRTAAPGGGVGDPRPTRTGAGTAPNMNGGHRPAPKTTASPRLVICGGRGAEWFGRDDVQREAGMHLFLDGCA